MTEAVNTVEATETPAAPKRKDLTNLRHRPFLVVNTIQRPAAGVNTSKKGWTDNAANWSLYENPYVVDRVSNKIMIESTVIIDVMRGTAVKNRFEGASDEEVTNHYIDKYREQVKEAMDIWLTKMATRMAADPNFAKSAKGDAAVEQLQGKIDAAVAQFEVVADQKPTE